MVRSECKYLPQGQGPHVDPWAIRICRGQMCDTAKLTISAGVRPQPIPFAREAGRRGSVETRGPVTSFQNLSPSLPPAQPETRHPI
jgi:hypothetical protein